jgi:hypothetical protein
MMVKPRILRIAWTVPGTGSGVCLAMRRHLVEREDFATFVLTNEGEYLLHKFRAKAAIRKFLDACFVR